MTIGTTHLFVQKEQKNIACAFAQAIEVYMQGKWRSLCKVPKNQLKGQAKIRLPICFTLPNSASISPSDSADAHAGLSSNVVHLRGNTQSPPKTTQHFSL